MKHLFIRISCKENRPHRSLVNSLNNLAVLNSFELVGSRLTAPVSDVLGIKVCRILHLHMIDSHQPCRLSLNIYRKIIHAVLAYILEDFLQKIRLLLAKALIGNQLISDIIINHDRTMRHI